MKKQNNYTNVGKKIKISVKLYENVVKTPKSNIENTFETRFVTEKQNKCTNVGRKNENICKCCMKISYRYQRNIENTLDICFCNRKNETVVLMLGEKKIENI